MKLPPQESQVELFIAKYSPDVARQLREARAKLRAFFPQGFELVFDNYNALVFGISTTERAKEAFISIAGYPKWVTLFFLYGTQLRDPKALLEGSGKQVRSIRLKTPEDINKPEVKDLIAQAIRPHEAALQAAPLLTTTIKVTMARQRPRRPAATKPKGATTNVAPSAGVSHKKRVAKIEGKPDADDLSTRKAKRAR